MTNKARLSELYSRISKHSQYQMPAMNMCGLIDADSKLRCHSHYENERLDFLLDKIDVRGKKILDIGGNTGYFSFELLNRGAESIVFYEGNKDHAEFVKEVADFLGLSRKLEVHSEYYGFSGSNDDNQYDIVLLLNVLHHVGDDYGEKFTTIGSAKNEIIRELLSVISKTEYIFFQLGFNWHGNRNMPLFTNGTKSEMIHFIHDGIKDYCDILHIGIAETTKSGRTKYMPLTDRNVMRDDAKGEFLNRPLFILRSKYADA